MRNLPAVQAVHEPAPWVDVVPAGQIVGVDVLHECSTGQLEHDVRPVDGAYEPETHGVQELALLVEMEPAGHSMMCVRLQNEPAEHGAQLDVLPSRRYVPGSHDEQVPSPGADVVPAGQMVIEEAVHECSARQSEHVASPAVGAYVPAAHGVHSVELPGATVPASHSTTCVPLHAEPNGHGVQYCAPNVALYEPSGQSTHTPSDVLSRVPSAHK